MRNTIMATMGTAFVASAAVTAEAALFIDGLPPGLYEDDPVVIGAEGLEFVNDQLDPPGRFVPEDNTASVVAGDGVRFVILDFDVDQAIPNGPYRRGVSNFSVTVTGDQGTAFSLTDVTDAFGFLMIPGTVQFDVQMGELLTFVFDGIAFANDTNFTPGYSVAALSDPIPVPPAGLLLGTAFALGTAVCRREPRRTARGREG